MLAEHEIHVRKVLTTLRANGVLLNSEKCEFHTKRIKYLGIIMLPEGISMDPAKVYIIQEWNTPKHVKDLQAFLGFANFYERFILSYSIVVNPTQLTKKDLVFAWTPEAQSAFEILKKAITTALIIMHFDQNKLVVVEIDASDSVWVGIFS